jgi:hypothetical protein
VFPTRASYRPAAGYPHQSYHWYVLQFERLSQLLKPILKLVGEREQTLLNSFYKGAIFRQWLLQPNCPPLLGFCRDLLDKAYGHNSRAAVSIQSTSDISGEADAERFTMDMEDIDFSRIDGLIADPLDDITPSDILRLTRSDDIECFVRVSAPYGFYAISSAIGIGNSFVCFKPVGPVTSDWIAGQIHHIFKQNKKMLMAIRRSTPIYNNFGEDPFSSFWKYGFEAKTVSTQFLEKLELVEMERIIAHTARWQVNAKQVVVLNLSRVSSEFSLIVVVSN